MCSFRSFDRKLENPENVENPTNPSVNSEMEP